MSAILRHMRWKLHGMIIEGDSNAPVVAAAWARTFASLPPVSAEPHLRCHLNLVTTVPSAPPGAPDFHQGNLLHYYVTPAGVTAHFPRFGQLYLDLAQGTTDGQIVAEALSTYGVLEDLIAISLSPHLRRRGYFLIHALAAAWRGRALLLVGGIGAGKTTTGMALLNAGWQLMSNDSPIVTAAAQVLSYPGLLAAYPETWARFPATQTLAQTPPPLAGRQKVLAAAEALWPDVWLAQAPLAAILFPQIETRADHALELLTAPEALRRLLPHAVEQWDRPLVAPHLTVLRQLVEAAPAYVLRLGPDVHTLPDRLGPLCLPAA